MSVVSSLCAFGLRQIIGDYADQVVDYAGQALPYAGPVVAAVRKRLDDHGQALPHALARANDRAWQAVGLALAGDGLFERFKDLVRDGDLKGVRDQVKAFLTAAPTGLEGAAAGARLKAADEWRRLRKAKRLSADALSGDDLAHKAASLERYGDPARLTAAAHTAVADAAAALKDDAPHLAALLTAAPPDGVPLLASAFAFFFRRELEANAELARGLTFDYLRRISERQERGFADLEAALGALSGRVLERLDGLFDQLGHLFDALGAIDAKLDWLIEKCGVATSTSDPLHISVTNKAELELLQKLLDQLLALPPQLVAAADWSKLGDVLAAAGQFGQADEAHRAAAAAARAAADRAAEAEAEYKRFRDACETEDRAAALTAFRRAVELDPARFAPFDLHRYTPTAVLGVGGFGTVFLADDLYVRVGADKKPQPTAIKAVHDSGLDALLERDLATTFDEADTLSALNHPGIVKTLNRGFGDPERRKRPYLVMEYFAGHTLQAWMKVKGTLPLDHVLRIARQIAEAVHEAHQLGIFHRDVKPANVMASYDKTTRQWRVKVIDFGLAVRLRAARASQEIPGGRRSSLDRSLAGTLRYAPPEQRNELDADVGPYSDVYAFGKTCLDLLFGTTEPKSFDWGALPEPQRKRVQDLLERATVDSLKRRWPNFEPVLAGLAALLGEPAAVAPAEPAEKKGRPADVEPTKVAASARPPQPQAPPEKLIANSLGMRLALIPAGTFLMGSPDDEAKRSEDEGPQHQVTISRPFYLGVYPVTVGEFRAFAQAAGFKTEAEKEGKGAYSWDGKEWKLDPKVNWRSPGWKLAENEPVTYVNWNDAVAFCRWLAKKEGRAYRLPTEAEWEYACRAGATTPFHFGASATPTQLICNGRLPYGGPKRPSIQRTSKVGSCPPNPWGLHDMHGNVWEWCADWYDKAFYQMGGKTDPQSVQSADARVVRGGSWIDNAEHCRSAFRGKSAPGVCDDNLGLRVCFRLD